MYEMTLISYNRMAEQTRNEKDAWTGTVEQCDEKRQATMPT